MNPQQPFGQQPNPFGTPEQPVAQPQAFPQASPQSYTPNPAFGPTPPVTPNPAPFIAPGGKPSKLWTIIAIVAIVVALGLGGAFAWAMVNYIDNRDNVESKVSSAVSVAVKEQADKDAADFLEKEKQPNRQFVGPDDFGRVSFDYPKTWSVYVAKDAVSTNSYEAYFSPVAVPAISNTQQYALRVTIETVDYDKEIDSYRTLVNRGDLKSSSVSADEQNGTRLDGAFTKDIRGSAVIFKIRDKTVTIRTDAQTFMGDFDALIQTITFNK